MLTRGPAERPLESLVLNRQFLLHAQNVAGKRMDAWIFYLKITGVGTPVFASITRAGFREQVQVRLNLNFEAPDIADPGNGVAGFITQDGGIDRFHYAENKPEGYPKNTPLSSGTSTLQFLRLLGTAMHLGQFSLVDLSHISGCNFPLALIRIALGQPTPNERLGFVIEPAARDFRDRRLPALLAPIPGLKEAAEMYVQRRGEPGQHCQELERLVASHEDLQLYKWALCDKKWFSPPLSASEYLLLLTEWKAI